MNEIDRNEIDIKDRNKIDRNEIDSKDNIEVSGPSLKHKSADHQLTCDCQQCCDEKHIESVRFFFMLGVTKPYEKKWRTPPYDERIIHLMENGQVCCEPKHSMKLLRAVERYLIDAVDSQPRDVRRYLKDHPQPCA